MRSRHSLPFALLSLLFALLLTSNNARAADDTFDDEYEERARVLRLSLLKGEVSLRRAGNIEWERAKLNMPLVEGDRLATGRDSRLEIQIDSRNFVRIGADSVLTVVTLRDEGIALSLSEGTATLRLSRFDRDKEYFEIDAPKTTVAAERAGEYRIDVANDGGVRVTVREDGRARVYSQNSGFDLRNNRTARLVYSGSDEGDWELSSASQFDEWDYWNDERELYLAQRLKHEGRERYYDREIYGAEELDLYGDWVNTSDYGYVWRPHTTVINNYYNWSPYRYGHWAWCPPYGWTWVADEPWGWAPYHYGRWVYYNNNWCWAPRGYGYNYRRARWRPALVVFVNLSHGNDRHVAWYPLGHGQRDPRGRWWDSRYDPLTPLRSGQVDNLRRANPALLRAVTSVPAREFGAGSVRARAASNDLAQRAIASEPVRGRMPVTPSDDARIGSPRRGAGGEGRVLAPGRGATDAGGRDVLSINRGTGVAPPRTIPNRDTGATTRTPGVPLDGELRRTHVFKNREPRVSTSSPSSGGAGTQGSDEGTGAVTRPNRAGRPTFDSGSNEDGNTPRIRPTRPSTPTVTLPSEPANAAGPRVRRSEPRPSPPPVFRSEPGERPSTPSRREESQPSRPERSAPPRNDPPPRQERPAPRNDPPPRQEAPRQQSPRQEAPRSAPREERPASPPKSESRPSREKPDDQR